MKERIPDLSEKLYFNSAFAVIAVLVTIGA